MSTQRDDPKVTLLSSPSLRPAAPTSVSTVGSGHKESTFVPGEPSSLALSCHLHWWWPQLGVKTEYATDMPPDNLLFLHHPCLSYCGHSLLWALPTASRPIILSSTNPVTALPPNQHCCWNYSQSLALELLRSMRNLLTTAHHSLAIKVFSKPS